ncbi:MAG: hypothetical protein AB2A00_04510 [Myxococcota bacterium]
MRSLLTTGQATPAIFRAALTSIPPLDRDAWLDSVLGLDGLPDDGPDLPSGCVPYLPCSVATLLLMVEHAGVHAGDVFVDVGSGLGRATALTHFLTGAAAVGIEVQPELVRISRELTRSLNATHISVVEGDAAQLTGDITVGTVFFLYCPFTGARLETVLGHLEAIASTRPIRVCCVDMPLLSYPWLTPVSLPSGELTVYRSTHPG